MPSYRVLGMMSGSSLDGLDLALCELHEANGTWTHRIVDAHTEPYDDQLRQRLMDVMVGSALDLARLHRDLGDRFGHAARDFLAGRTCDLISSHGHTLFHRPAEGLTTQVGCGARIAAITGITTVCDLRTMDVALGGQGAPLVPWGERLLFPGYDAFLNIGGICNLSFHDASGTVGHDICVGNQALNLLAQEAGSHYDDGGSLARSGRLHQALLDRLIDLPFHRTPPPRSLGREWFDTEMKPLLSDASIPLMDRARSVTELIARLVGDALRERGFQRCLASGGGVHNTFLMERIRVHAGGVIEVPEKLLADHKEALVFALLGALRLCGEANAIASVTGALRDSVGGAIYAAN